jgi:hypothetical protein
LRELEVVLEVPVVLTVDKVLALEVEPEEV